MEKNIKVDEDVWKELNKEKIDRGFKRISDVIKEKINFFKKNEKEKYK